MLIFCQLFSRYMAVGESTCKTQKAELNLVVMSPWENTLISIIPLVLPQLLAVSVQFQHTFVLLLLENLQGLMGWAPLGDLFWSLHLGWAFVFALSIIPLPSITASSQLPNNQSQFLFIIILSQLHCLSRVNKGGCYALILFAETFQTLKIFCHTSFFSL